MSIFEKFKKIRLSTKNENTHNHAYTYNNNLENIPRYPPFIQGLPAASIDQILETQKELISKIKVSLGYNNIEFDKFLLPVIKNYVEYVHLLPASETHHHRGAGGLFRHGLEVAYYCCVLSESFIFSKANSPRERRREEPVWRLACCISGLLHDIGKPFSDVAILDMTGSIEWNPYIGSLSKWLSDKNIDRYFIRWKSRSHHQHEKFSLLAIHNILTEDVLTELALGGAKSEIMSQLLSTVTGTIIENQMTSIMLQADRESVRKDLINSRMDIDEYSYGVPISRYIIDSIRRLVKSGKWKVNEKGANVWRINEGTFVLWQNLTDIFNLIDKDSIPGIPRGVDTLADILIEQGFAKENIVVKKNRQTINYRYWMIQPNILAGIKLLTLKFESCEFIFGDEEPPAPVEAIIVQESNLNIENNTNDCQSKTLENKIETIEPKPKERPLRTSQISNESSSKLTESEFTAVTAENKLAELTGTLPNNENTAEGTTGGGIEKNVNDLANSQISNESSSKLTESEFTAVTAENKLAELTGTLPNNENTAEGTTGGVIEKNVNDLTNNKQPEGDLGRNKKTDKNSKVMQIDNNVDPNNPLANLIEYGGSLGYNVSEDDSRISSTKNNQKNLDKSEHKVETMSNMSSMSRTDKEDIYNKNLETDSEEQHSSRKLTYYQFKDKYKNTTAFIEPIINSLNSNEFKSGNVFIDNKRICICYLNFVKKLGASQVEKILSSLSAKNLIFKNIIFPNNVTHLVKGNKCLILNEELSKDILDLLPQEIDIVVEKPTNEVEEVLEKLKIMLKNKHGDWLVSSIDVVNLDNKKYLATSLKCLDVISMQYENISKHLLRGAIANDNNRPRLKIDKQKELLYLELDEDIKQ